MTVEAVWTGRRGAAPGEAEVSSFRLRGGAVHFKFAESLTTRKEGGYPCLRFGTLGGRRCISN